MSEPRYPMGLSLRRRCFRGLVKLCGEYGVLPSSHIIPESKVQKLGYCPISLGGSSNIWPGIYNGDDGHDGDKCVAIKVIRYFDSEDVQTVKKARCFDPLPHMIEPDWDCLQNFCREVITWKRLSHPNILELIGVTMDEKEYSMVSPWMENGNIVEFLREDLQANPLKLVRPMLHFVHHFVDYCHS